jgi:hypothetical protein
MSAPLDLDALRLSGPGYVIGSTRCPGRSCRCVVQVRLARASHHTEEHPRPAKKSYSSCDGAADPQGLGCGIRVHWSNHDTNQWMREHLAALAIAAGGPVPDIQPKKSTDDGVLF